MFIERNTTCYRAIYLFSSLPTSPKMIQSLAPRVYRFQMDANSFLNLLHDWDKYNKSSLYFTKLIDITLMNKMNKIEFYDVFLYSNEL